MAHGRSIPAAPAAYSAVATAIATTVATAIATTVATAVVAALPWGLALQVLAKAWSSINYKILSETLYHKILIARLAHQSFRRKQCSILSKKK